MTTMLTRATENPSLAVLPLGFGLMGLAVRGVVGILFPSWAPDFPGDASMAPLVVALFGWILLTGAFKSGQRHVSRVQRAIFELAGLLTVFAVASAVLSPIAWAWPIALPLGLFATLAGISACWRSRPFHDRQNRADPETGQFGVTYATTPSDDPELSRDARLKEAALHTSFWRSDPIEPRQGTNQGDGDH
jgi:hypothetical protein